MIIVIVMLSGRRASSERAAQTRAPARHPRRVPLRRRDARRGALRGAGAPDGQPARGDRHAQGVRRARRRLGRRLHDPAGIDRQPDRPERGREDDVLQHDHRRLQADARPGRVRRRRPDREAAARGHRARDRAHLPEHPPLPGHDLARERPRRDALPAEERDPRRHPPHAEGEARGGRGEEAGARAARLLLAVRSRRGLRPQPPVRRPAAARGRPGARDRSRSSCCSTSRPRG